MIKILRQWSGKSYVSAEIEVDGKRLQVAFHGPEISRQMQEWGASASEPPDGYLGVSGAGGTLLVSESPHWVWGTGSDLPNGTQAWVAYRDHRGMPVVRLSYRSPGGWGWQEDLHEGPEYPDDGDPDLYIKERGAVLLCTGPRIVAYSLQPTPEPPKEP